MRSLRSARETLADLGRPVLVRDEFHPCCDHCRADKRHHWIGGHIAPCGACIRAAPSEDTPGQPADRNEDTRG